MKRKKIRTHLIYYISINEKDYNKIYDLSKVKQFSYVFFFYLQKYNFILNNITSK